MGEEVGVEAPQRPEDIGPAAEGGARHPEDVARIVVLPLVALGALQNPAAAEGITQKIDVSARRTGILELLGLAERPQAGRNGRHVGMALQFGDERREPPRGGLDVGVEQHVVVRLDVFERAVVAARKAVIGIHRHHLDPGELFAEQPQRVVRRAVVGHDHAGPVGRRHDTRQEAAQMLRTVPVEYDDFNR